MASKSEGGVAESCPESASQCAELGEKRSRVLTSRAIPAGLGPASSGTSKLGPAASNDAGGTDVPPDPIISWATPPRTSGPLFPPSMQLALINPVVAIPSANTPYKQLAAQTPPTPQKLSERPPQRWPQIRNHHLHPWPEVVVRVRRGVHLHILPAAVCEPEGRLALRFG